MDDRQEKVRDRLATWALRRLFDALEKGDSRWQLSGFLHRLTAAGPAMFQDALAALVREKGWSASAKLLLELRQSPLGSWIPAELVPTLAILDLEWSADTGIREIALLRSWGLMDTPQVSSGAAAPGAGLAVHEIEKVLAPLREIHPWILHHNGADSTLTSCFAPQRSRPEDAPLIDHAAALRFPYDGGALIFLDCEYLEEAAPEALGDVVSIEAAAPDLVQPVRQFMEPRILGRWSVYDRPASHRLTKADADDPAFHALVSACRAQPAAKGRQLAELLALPLPEDQFVVVTTRDLGDERVLLRVLRFPRCLLGALKARLADFARCAVFACGPVGDSLLAAQLRALFPDGIVVSRNEPSHEVNIGVIQDGTLGSTSGLGRGLVAVARHIVNRWHADPAADAPSFLGVSAEVQSVVASALRKGGVKAFASTLFGSRSRTASRVDDEERGVFIAGSHPLPLPSFVKRVIVSRLPFPGRTDPLVLAHLTERGSADDAFVDVIMPRMLRRLRRDASLLGSAGIALSLLDRRALIYPEVRREIQRLIGRVQPEGEPPAVRDGGTGGAEPPIMEAVLASLKAGLASVGIREGRDAYKDVDATPVLRRLLYVALTRAEEELLVIGDAGNIFFDEVCRAGRDDIRRFVWTQPIRTTDEEVSSGLAVGGGRPRGRAAGRGIEDELAAIKEEAEGRDASHEQYVSIAETNLLGQFRAMFGNQERRD